MNNPFDYIPDAACKESFLRLTERIEALRQSSKPEDAAFCRGLDEGKMLGVLIATDKDGHYHKLFAFSGQIGELGFQFPGFVGPVFDYLQSDGHFKKREAEISLQNLEIARYEGELSILRDNLLRRKDCLMNEVATFKEKCRQSKLKRKIRREMGATDEETLSAMIHRSQFEKAELRRLKKRVAENLKPLEEKVRNAEAHLRALVMKRRQESEELQRWLFTHTRVMNAKGEERSMLDIFSATSMKYPPSGAGECCAPKLLHAAYRHGWHPQSIAEFWYGNSKGGEVRIHGRHYPACRGKCLPVLVWMLQGLSVEPPVESTMLTTERTPEVIFENEWFCVVDKPAGMLSVPGKSRELSVEQWLEKRYGSRSSIRMVHRLDQDTSGLIIAALDPNTLKIMHSLFAKRNVKKIYVAELDGDYATRGIPREGQIELPLRPDVYDRPRQLVDNEKGKEAITHYQFKEVTNGRSRVYFRPLTGRTHQLRVHAASGLGLGMPISGDRLYGAHSGNPNERLRLHATKIEFTFPTDGKEYSFESPSPF